MDELIKMLSDKLGVSPDKASMAVQLIANHLKQKAPALSGQIDSLLAGGESAASGGLGDVASKLGGLMGGKE
jgi:hypothetical protein